MAPKLPPPANTKAVFAGPAWSDTDKVLFAPAVDALTKSYATFGCVYSNGKRGCAIKIGCEDTIVIPERTGRVQRPTLRPSFRDGPKDQTRKDRKSTRLNSSHQIITLSLHDALPIYTDKVLFAPAVDALTKSYATFGCVYSNGKRGCAIKIGCEDTIVIPERTGRVQRPTLRPSFRDGPKDQTR